MRVYLSFSLSPVAIGSDLAIRLLGAGRRPASGDDYYALSAFRATRFPPSSLILLPLPAGKANSELVASARDFHEVMNNQRRCEIFHL